MEKTSFDHLWDLLSPSPQYADRKDACRTYWDSHTVQWQRRVYYTLREQKKRGETIKENPLFAIQDCTPQPTNLNGSPHINERIQTEKLVIAFYDGKYGTYTKQEAYLFEMTNVKPLNF